MWFSNAHNEDVLRWSIVDDSDAPHRMCLFVFIIAMSSERVRTRDVAIVNILTTRRLGSHQSAGLIAVPV